MMLSAPMADASFYLAQKIEATLFGQMSEVANKICDGMLVACAAMSLEDCHRLGGPRDVVWLVDHGDSPTTPLVAPEILKPIQCQFHVVAACRVMRVLSSGHPVSHTNTIYLNCGGSQSREIWHDENIEGTHYLVIIQTEQGSGKTDD
jgi:hypothetical protein